MKKWINSIAVLGLALLLFLGYAIPTMVTEFEDAHLQSANKSYAIEKIELNSHEIDFMEEFGCFSELIVGQFFIQQETERESGRVYENAKDIITDFLFMLTGNAEIKLDNLTVSSLVIADTNTGKVYPIWYCEAGNQESRYLFWIDEITGKVLAFEIPSDVFLSDGETFVIGMEILANYYNLDFGGYTEEYAKIFMLGYGEGILEVLDKETKKGIFLPVYRRDNHVGFNIYPETFYVDYIPSQEK